MKSKKMKMKIRLKDNVMTAGSNSHADTFQPFWAEQDVPRDMA